MNTLHRPAAPPSTAQPIRDRTPWPRALAGLTALATLLMLAACGPGVGGTGVGPTHGLAFFGATTEPLCDSSLADALRCEAGTSGTAPLLLADGDPARAGNGRLDGQRIELQWLCDGWRFTGQWGRASSPAEPRFFGTASRAGGEQPATLVLRAQGEGFVAELLDTGGQSLAPPLTLRVMGAPVTIAPFC